MYLQVEGGGGHAINTTHGYEILIFDYSPASLFLIMLPLLQWLLLNGILQN